MTNPNVQPNTPTSDPWADIAAELHKLADDVLALVGEPAPACFDISIQPRNPDSYLRSLVKNRPAIIATVDAIAMALLDKPSEDHRMSDGTFHRDAKGRRGRISVSILTSIADPNAVDPEQEIARLRAENAELRAKAKRPIPPTDPDDLPRAWPRADAPEDGELTTPGEPEPEPVVLTASGLTEAAARCTSRPRSASPPRTARSAVSRSRSSTWPSTCGSGTRPTTARCTRSCRPWPTPSARTTARDPARRSPPPSRRPARAAAARGSQRPGPPRRRDPPADSTKDIEMSHFAVLICLPASTPMEKLEDEIGRRMERWNEDRDVAPYRVYEEGAAEDYWWVSSVRRGAQELRDGAPSKVRHDDLFKWWSLGGAYHFTTEAEAEEHERKDRESDARWADRLGEHPTWETVAKLYNERYGHGAEVATADDTSDSETLRYDPESGRAYTISTRNPESMWDYWRIGGRWGDYFLARSGAGLITARRGWDSPERPTDGKVRAEGGPKRLLDFEGMRAEAEVKANAECDKWDAVCADTPVAQGWQEISSLARLGEITWDEARHRYRSQPRIEAARMAGIDAWGDCPVETFLSGREEYVAEQRRGAVPGYALVTLDEEWAAPGRMGWFGMSSDEPGTRSAYRSAVNTYLDDKVAADDFVVVLDCHI